MSTPNPPSIMSAHQRACDICAAQKSQCSAEQPCSRCHRLSLHCTYDRPKRARGRPRKDAVARQRRLSSSVTSDAVVVPSTSEPEEPVLRLLLRYDQLPVSTPLAAEILGHVLSNVHHTSYLSVLRSDHHKLAAHGPYSAFISCRSVLCVLLACGLSLSPLRGESDTLAENCRIHALSDIPILTWKSRPIHRGDVYSLYLLANLGYLHGETTAMADRWAALASCLHHVDHTSLDADDPEMEEVDRRLSRLLSINSHVQRLLYNRPYSEGAIPNAFHRSATSGPNRDPPSAHVIDRDWHHLPRTGTRRDGYLDTPEDIGQSEGFFDLFDPLELPLRLALSLPSFKSDTYTVVTDHLETYFTSFPTRLMYFDNVAMPWQFEAMIWLHGICIILNIGADFLQILLYVQFPANPAFAHAVDHAILLGEILAAFNATMSAAHLSHSTIFFIALSATLHSAMLPLATREPSVLHTLNDSAETHKHALAAILDGNRNCDHPLIQSTLAILTLNIDMACNPNRFLETELADLIQIQKYYRWIPQGSGLIRLKQDRANRLYNASSEHCPASHMSMELSPLMLSVFDPGLRICESNTFQFSVLL